MVGRPKKESIPPEEWREVVSVRRPKLGRYMVSNRGELRHEYDLGKYRKLVPRDRTSTHGCHRMVFSFSYRYRKTERFLSRVVWEAFNGPIPKGHVVIHRDMDYRNNALWNLKLVTRKYVGDVYGQLSENNKNKRRTIARIDTDGNVIAFYRSSREAANAYGALSYQSILDRCNHRLVRDTWLPDGTTFVWEDELIDD